MLNRLACTCWSAAASSLLGAESAAAGRAWTVLPNLAAYGTAGAHHFGSSTAADTPASADQQRKAAVGRLLYRSKQRGFLEMDLLVGLWAERNLPKMDAPHLSAFEAVLDQENPDLFKWLTGQEEAPNDMLANPAFIDLRRDVAERLAAHADNKAMSRAGADWIRGYDDWNQPQGPNAAAAAPLAPAT